MTATKYALVPVVATEEMRAIFRAERGSGTEFTHTVLQCADFDSRYFQMLAAAPKELPEEVVSAAAGAYASGHSMRILDALNDGSKSIHDAHKEAHRAGIRAALLAVMGD